MSDLPVFNLHKGSIPLLVSIPHCGTFIPEDIKQQLLPLALDVRDTDWHLPILYAFAKEMGASVLQANMSRYVIDLNRPIDQTNLYPGQDTTLLCPIDNFDRQPLYPEGKTPSQDEINRRRQLYWQPYHDALSAELARIKATHGHAVLWDAHSIRSVLPRFFEGKLTDLNLGTGGGSSCDPKLADRVLACAKTATPFTSVLNGRFTGGTITRSYGQPANNIHAIQLEMTWCSYMHEEPPYAYAPERAAKVQPVLKQMLQLCADWKF
ncbi:N-formylglutamate deformylase [Orrella sp. NBD-18]|uniref:N-formylglutamate deformylase n=1 Tax=Sheuella amnicola TaxID=2707330 RepID=A0A6B2QWN9_9BURK|nr:N-formylglutamate deformylase [Sheuella amnicola]NDY82541.1 N-formylglutamate deformylase [Sheuella amnicola]